MIANSTVTLGLAVGEGTGPELAAVFERVVLHLARLYQVKLDIERSPRLYQSYHSLMAGGTLEHASQLTLDDARHYEDYCRELAQAGVAAIFRTAMNAQSLYLVRQRLQAVKVERLSTDAVDLLLVRDQAQGFYTGDNTCDPSRGILARACEFSRDLTVRILEFSIEEARRCWGAGPIDRIVMAYKFHLLDGVFAAWVREWSDRTGIEIELYQPDTTNRNLLRGELGGRMLIIGSNEWADIMHVVLLHMLGREHQENRATRNVYLHAALNGLTEYQTVHGSADDIAGKDCVNPFATMRAATAMMERHAACAGAERLMEATLHRLTEAGVATPDLGGKSSTSEVVAATLDFLSRESPRTARPSDGSEVADLQPDRLASGKGPVLVAS